MIRAVIDVNVVIQGSITRIEPSRRVLVALMTGRFEAVVTDELIGELEDVVGRSTTEHPRIDRVVLAAVLEMLSKEPRLDIHATRSPVTVRDPKDVYLIQSALAGSADYLVTADNDLLVLADDLRPFGVEVVTPARFVEVLDGR